MLIINTSKLLFNLFGKSIRFIKEFSLTYSIMSDEEKDTIEKILSFLKASKDGATPSDIARKTSINRMTVSKYLNILKVIHFVDYKEVGMSKVYFITQAPVFKGLDNWDSTSPIKKMVDDFGVGVVITDKDMNIKWFNKYVEKRTGKRPEQFKEKPCYAIFRGKSEECSNCPAKKTLSDGKAHKELKTIPGKDGEKVSLMVITSPLKDIHGKINGVLEMIVDVSGMIR